MDLNISEYTTSIENQYTMFRERVLCVHLHPEEKKKKKKQDDSNEQESTD